MSLHKPVSGQVFSLDHLFSRLLNFATARLKRRGCYKPGDCALDVVSRCLIDEPHRRRKAKKPGRIVILDDEKSVQINFPGARNQRSVLYEHLKDKISKKHSRCKECKWKSKECEIAGDFVNKEGGERRTGVEVISEAASPEEAYEQKELIEKCLGTISDPVQREDFEAFVLGNRTHVKIGEERNKNPSTIRQQYHRNKKTVADFIDRTFFKRRDE